MKFSIGDTVRVFGKRGEVLDYAAGVDRYLVRLKGVKLVEEQIVNPSNMVLLQSAELKENE